MTHLPTSTETGIKRILLGRKWARRSDNLVSCKKRSLLNLSYIYTYWDYKLAKAYSPYFTTTFPLTSWCVYSEEVCRKKWKCLRDTYIKERRKDTEKRSGSAAGSGKKWKYSAVLSFLDPFVSPRETSGNMERGDEENQASRVRPPRGPGRDRSSSSRAVRDRRCVDKWSNTTGHICCFFMMKSLN